MSLPPRLTPEGPMEARGVLLACYGPKGGAGRSTLATNLAIALRQATARETLLFDAACQFGELDLFLNLQPRLGIPTVLGGGHLDAALTPHPTGLHLLGWTKSDRSVSPEKLKGLLQNLRQRDAWIVIDTHPALNEINRVVLELADRIFVPFFLDLAHLRALQRDLTLLTEGGCDVGRAELVAWAEKSDLSWHDAANIIRRPISYQLPYDPEAARSAINQGVPMIQGDPHGAFAREMYKLIEPLLGPRSTALVSLQHPLSGLLAWFRRGTASGLGF